MQLKQQHNASLSGVPVLKCWVFWLNIKKLSLEFESDSRLFVSDADSINPDLLNANAITRKFKKINLKETESPNFKGYTKKICDSEKKDLMATSGRVFYAMTWQK